QRNADEPEPFAGRRPGPGDRRGDWPDHAPVPASAGECCLPSARRPPGSRQEPEHKQVAEMWTCVPSDNYDGMQCSTVRCDSELSGKVPIQHQKASYEQLDT